MYVSNRKGDHLEQCHLMIHELLIEFFVTQQKKLLFHHIQKAMQNLKIHDT